MSENKPLTYKFLPANTDCVGIPSLYPERTPAEHVKDQKFDTYWYSGTNNATLTLTFPNKLELLSVRVFTCSLSGVTERGTFRLWGKYEINSDPVEIGTQFVSVTADYQNPQPIEFVFPVFHTTDSTSPESNQRSYQQLCLICEGISVVNEVQIVEVSKAIDMR
ncbi:hypothetical protein [Bacillus sp. BH32]|uniref:hypothetical protein n=1 Tax=Bacillus sp. BH32 TaxID=2528961 RepID=UPI0010639CE0|nr:hypothetical protein [Bacillus sp. BH32]NYS76102.1 hypothetical protein [Bacillus sp. BH32]